MCVCGVKLHMCVCMFAPVCANSVSNRVCCVRVCGFACLCIYVCMNGCLCMCVHMCTNPPLCACVCVFVCARACVCACMSVLVCVHGCLYEPLGTFKIRIRKLLDRFNVFFPVQLSKKGSQLSEGCVLHVWGVSCCMVSAMNV